MFFTFHQIVSHTKYAKIYIKIGILKNYFLTIINYQFIVDVVQRILNFAKMQRKNNYIYEKLLYQRDNE